MILICGTKEETSLYLDDSVRYCFECCDKDLGDSILITYKNATSSIEFDLLLVIEKLALTTIAAIAKID